MNTYQTRVVSERPIFRQFIFENFHDANISEI